MTYRHLLLLIPLLTASIAGCLDTEGEDDPLASQPFSMKDATGHVVPELLCFTPLDGDDDTALALPDGPMTRCNFEMTPDAGREGNEVTIAVNPTNPRNIVGGAKDYYEPDAGECVWNGVYVTEDGGRNAYQDRSFDGSPWRLAAGDLDNFEPNYATQFWCTTDPVAYFDVGGNLYYLLMAYQGDPITGSKTGEGTLPNGALNDWAFNRATQIVAKSTDGGQTFETFTPVLEGTFPIDFHDKGWIAASADGTIHVMWLAVLAPGNMYCRSTDDGESFQCLDILAATVGTGIDIETGVVDIQGGSSGQGSFLDVGTGDEVYASWYNGGIQLARSMDTGATWDSLGMIHGTNPQSMPGLESRDRRTGYPAMATDRNPESPFADAIYTVWNDRCGDDAWKPIADCATSGNNSIYFSASFDKGETWTDGVRISDASATDAWSIFPAVSVSPGGVIDVSWMDTRDVRYFDCHAGTPTCEQGYGDAYPALEQYYTYSLDGGKTWSQDFSVRDAGDHGWDPALCHHQNGMVFIGDYNDIDSSWEAAHPVWPDTRLGACDVFTATIQRPMFAEGWTMEGMDAAKQFVAEHPL